MNLDTDDGIVRSTGWIKPPCESSIRGGPYEPPAYPSPVSARVIVPIAASLCMAGFCRTNRDMTGRSAALSTRECSPVQERSHASPASSLTVGWTAL